MTSQSSSLHYNVPSRSRDVSQRTKQYGELHSQVDASIALLDSLENFLSTFQTDLSAVSGQISDLQARSKDIDNRLKARKKIEKPLSHLISDLCIPPGLATIILDTDVGEPWLTAIPDFQSRLYSVKARGRVKAARDLSEVAEGLRLVAATKLRSLFLSLIQPIRANMSTNLPVLQSSVLLRYKQLYVFLQLQASDVAQEIQRAYIAAARVYHETGFRRYARTLGWIKARTAEKFETIATAGYVTDMSVDEGRLAFARIAGPPVTLAHLGDDKNYKEPVESLFRSLLLVLMDNATAEYNFLLNFFTEPPTISLDNSDSGNFPVSPGEPGRTFRRDSGASLSPSISELPRGNSLMGSLHASQSLSKDTRKSLAALWKQIMEPALNYCQTFGSSVVEPQPAVIPLLTIIRINEEVIAETQARDCPPLENFLFGLRLQFWPVFQKLMTEHITSVGKLTEGATGYFKRGPTIADSVVQKIMMQYTAMFTSFCTLTVNEDETMIFSNLSRLRQEITSLIVFQSKKLSDTTQNATFQSRMFEIPLHALSREESLARHGKAQAEIAYWREREANARKRITATQV